MPAPVVSCAISGSFLVTCTQGPQRAIKSTQPELINA
jgi:hypothetical protein